MMKNAVDAQISMRSVLEEPWIHRAIYLFWIPNLHIREEPAKKSIEPLKNVHESSPLRRAIQSFGQRS